MKVPSVSDMQQAIGQFIGDIRQREVIASYCAIRFLGGAAQFIIAATFIPFLLGHGLSLFQASIVVSTFTATNVLIQLPTGAIADAAGRKLSVIFSGAFLGIGFAVFAISSKLMEFVAAEILVAVGVAFYGGALNAWLYDHLELTGQKWRSERTFAKAALFSLTGTALAGLAGGYLAVINPAWPWIGGSILSVLQLIAAASLMREYPHEVEVTHELGWREFPNIMRDSIRYIRHHAIIPWLLGAAFIAQAGLQPLHEFWAPWLGQLAGGNHPAWLGWFWAGISMAFALGSEAARRSSNGKNHDIQVRLVRASVLLAIPMILSAIGPGLYLTLGWLLVNQIGEGLYSPVSQQYLNQQIDGWYGRATILSMDITIGQIGAVASLLAFGRLAQITSIGFTWLIGGTGLLLLGPIYWQAHRKERLLNQA